MDYKVFIPVLISFVLSVILGPLVIPVLRRLKMDQTEREDGVQSHLKKTGTPTMGGVMILSGCCDYFSYLYWSLSKDYSDSVSDTWFWTDRIPG